MCLGIFIWNSSINGDHLVVVCVRGEGQELPGVGALAIVINFVNGSVTKSVGRGGDNPEWGVALGMSFVKSSNQ